MKPRIGIVSGDPCGIGPELVAKLLADPASRERADLAVIGDRRVLEAGMRIAGVSVDTRPAEEDGQITLAGGVPTLIDRPAFDPGTITLGQVSTEAGRWQLDCLALALKLARDGRIDGVCFAPLNKEAMHLAGLTHEDEQGFFADELGHTGPLGILNTVGNLWTSRVTSHVSHKQVSDLITFEGVLDAIRLADTTMRKAGYDCPRLAVAGLNPHAGDGGAFGREEIETIGPAVERARAEGAAAEGPFPPDTIFLKGRDGVYDAIVTMYHDQGQIAMKLMGFDRGVTVHAGLPFPVTTSAHGSAFDIAGQNKGNVDALRQAFLLACEMAKTASAQAA